MPRPMVASNNASSEGHLTPAQLETMHRTLYNRLPMQVIRQLTLEQVAFASGKKNNQDTTSSASPASVSSNDASAVYPEYAQLHARLMTFTRWPHYGNGGARSNEHSDEDDSEDSHDEDDDDAALDEDNDSDASSVRAAERIAKEGYRLATPFSLALEGFFSPQNEDSSAEDLCVCFACGTRLCRWEPVDVPHAEHKKATSRTSNTGGTTFTCPLLRMREQAGVQPSAIAVERDLTRIPLSSLVSPVELRVRAERKEAAVAKARQEQERTDPLFLPIPADHIRAAVFVTPVTPSKPPIASDDTSSSYIVGSYRNQFMPAISPSESPNEMTPLSAFDRVRHRHLKRLRSAWSVATYGDEVAEPAKTAATALVPVISSSGTTPRRGGHAVASSQSAAEQRQHQSLVNEATSLQSLLDRRQNLAARKRARTSNSGSASSAAAAAELDQHDTEVTASIQTHLNDLRAKIAALEGKQSSSSAATRTTSSAAATSTPTQPTQLVPQQQPISNGMMRTIFIQELATAMLTEY